MKVLKMIFDSKTEIKKGAAINSFLFFITWFSILLFIADNPPPKGFIMFPIILLFLSLILFVYSLYFIPRLLLDEKYLFFKSLAHSIIAGLVLGLLLALIPGGEPSIQITIYDKLILIGVIILINILNGIGLYIFDLILVKSGYFSSL